MQPDIFKIASESEGQGQGEGWVGGGGVGSGGVGGVGGVCGGGMGGGGKEGGARGCDGVVADGDSMLWGLGVEVNGAEGKEGDKWG